MLLSTVGVESRTSLPSSLRAPVTITNCTSSKINPSTNSPMPVTFPNCMPTPKREQEQTFAVPAHFYRSANLHLSGCSILSCGLRRGIAMRHRATRFIQPLRPAYQAKQFTTQTSQQVFPLIQRKSRRRDLCQFAKQLRVRTREVEARLPLHLLFQVGRQLLHERCVPIQRHQVKADIRSPCDDRSEKQRLSLVAC